MRRLALVLVLVVVAGSLVACGSGKKTPVATTSGPSNAEQIKTTYLKFFSSKTPVATRVSLLQNGSKFTSLITALAKNPLASNTSATVSSVTIVTQVYAKVVYTVNISGTAVPGLKNRTGTAVRASANGTWQVGDASFCALVELQSKPPQCRNP